MKCPQCHKELTKVRVYSECWQYGYIDKLKNAKKIESYGEISELTETTGIECPECGADLENIIEEY